MLHLNSVTLLSHEVICPTVPRPLHSQKCREEPWESALALRVTMIAAGVHAGARNPTKASTSPLANAEQIPTPINAMNGVTRRLEDGTLTAHLRRSRLAKSHYPRHWWLGK